MDEIDADADGRNKEQTMFVDKLKTTWMATSVGTRPESTSGIILDFPNASSFTLPL